MARFTFYVIRTTKDSPIDETYNPFKKDWYVSNRYVKKFKDAKIFSTPGKASNYLQSTTHLPWVDRKEYFEIVPVTVIEPEPYATIYKIGDFVGYTEGMGEGWFGTITDISHDRYEIKQWTLPNCAVPGSVTVSHADMRGVSTPEKAMEYHLIRVE